MRTRGAQKEINTPTGKVRLKIPPGTQLDTRFRIPGRGLPQTNPPGSAGDFFAEVRIRIPETLSDEDRDHWKALARSAEP